MRINVLGHGTMGLQVAALLQVLGHDVFVWTRAVSAERTRRQSQAVRLLKRVLSLTAAEGQCTIVANLADLTPALTIECLPENLEIKHKALERLSYGIGDVEFFTNTSSLAPASLSDGAVGLHFFNPIHVVRLVELSCSVDSLGPGGKLLMEELRAAGYDAIPVKPNPGYVGNFMLFHEISAALKLLDRHGYDSNVIDQVWKKLGHEASIFDVIDLIGVDVSRDILSQLSEVDAGFYVSPLLGKAISLNILGRKNRTSIRSLIDRGPVQ